MRSTRLGEKTHMQAKFKLHQRTSGVESKVNTHLSTHVRRCSGV